MIGPAQAPRPTSSIPTTTWCPSAHSSRSIVSLGAADRRVGAMWSEDRRRLTDLVCNPPRYNHMNWSTKQDLGWAGLHRADLGEPVLGHQLGRVASADRREEAAGGLRVVGQRLQGGG